MFATRFGARAGGRVVGLPSAAARLFASSAPRSIDRDAAPSKPDLVGETTPSPPPPSATGSAVPLSLKTGNNSSSSSGSKSPSAVSSSPSSSKPTPSSTTTMAALPPILSTSSTLGKPAFTLPTVLSQDWLFAPSSSSAAQGFGGADFDPDAPDSSLWALESEIITWFPPSHPNIGRSTPAQAHAEAVAAAGSRRSPSTTAIFDEDETYFTHSLFRQLAVSHLASQATADRGISAEGAEAIRAMDVFKQSFRDADEALNELEQAGASIRLDSVVRKRKKKMSKHKYKKRIKAQKAMRKKLGK